MAWMAAMILGTFLGMCIYARVRATTNLAEALAVRSRVASATRTKIVDAPAVGAILITGKVRSASGESVTAIFTGGNALWVRAEARTNMGSVIDHWDRKVETIVVDDGSGRVANVTMDGATMRIEAKSVSGSENQKRVTAYFDALNRSPGSGEFYYEASLIPGDTISVLATPTGDGGYRESAGAITLSSEAGELLLFDGDEDEAKPNLYRSYISTATVGIVLFGLATAIALAVAVLA